MATSATATVYRKTAAGQAELSQRQARLAPRARMALVMVNGAAPVARLVETLGAEVSAVLQQLVDKGLIELVTAAEPAAATASATPAAASASLSAAASAAPTAAPATTSGPPPSVLRSLLELLVPHFGPDATRVADAALRANTPHDYHAALDAVGARLAIHLGRKKADELLAPLRLPVA